MAISLIKKQYLLEVDYVVRRTIELKYDTKNSPEKIFKTIKAEVEKHIRENNYKFNVDDIISEGMGIFSFKRAN